MESLDLNLLVALDALLEEGGVTGAAERLGVSAPASPVPSREGSARIRVTPAIVSLSFTRRSPSLSSRPTLAKAARNVRTSSVSTPGSNRRPPILRRSSSSRTSL